MNKKTNYKLNKIKKVGIAVGLSLIISFSATACAGGILHLTNNTNSTKNTINSSQTQTITSDYIKALKSNEFNVYDEDQNTISISLTNYDHMNFVDQLTSPVTDFKLNEYYHIEEALNVYNSTQINKSNESGLLDVNGNLDVNKLIQVVQKNNKQYLERDVYNRNTFFSEMNTSDITKICTLITEIVNSKFNNIEIEKVANTLTKLTMFERKGSMSNAYVTSDLNFIYNPNMTEMYADVKEIAGETENPDEILKSVIVHEIMHLLEYNTNDINEENGIEAGICRMYNLTNKEKKVTIDSLWNTWLLEAAAELGMSEYLKIEPGTYAKKISYITSYNLSRFNEINLETNGLETTAFQSTLEEAYKTLKLNTQEEQREFLNYLYSIEIIQGDTKDFWENYSKLTNTNITDAQKKEIQMDIRTDAVKYLTRKFYKNLADSIKAGKTNDLDTAFYIIRNWELDIYGHLEYTKTVPLSHAKDFIIWHGNIQTQFFNAIAESNNMQTNDIINLYTEYNLQANVGEQIYNNCNLSNYDKYTQEYILSSKKKYSSSNFSRNIDVLAYLNESEEKVTEKEPVK